MTSRPPYPWRSTLSRAREQADAMENISMKNCGEDMFGQYPTKPPEKPQQFEHQRVFLFLDLPRELRDQIYDHLFEKKGKRVIDSTTARARHIAALEYKTPYTSTTAILATNQQIHNEALQMLYKRRKYLIHMDGESPRFISCKPRTRRYYSPLHAVPCGWDLSLIGNLALHIDLAGSKFTEETLNTLEFDGLKGMTALRNLRIVFTMLKINRQTVHGPNQIEYPGQYDPPLALSHFDEHGHHSQGILSVRKMMVRLVSSLPSKLTELRFGVDDVRELFGLDVAKTLIQIAPDFLRRVALGLNEFQDWKFEGWRGDQGVQRFSKLSLGT